MKIPHELSLATEDLPRFIREGRIRLMDIESHPDGGWWILAAVDGDREFEIRHLNGKWQLKEFWSGG